MRAGITCVLLVLTIRRDGVAEGEGEFRPTPIPLSEWRDARELRAEGTRPPPQHYWEDALRHSVYLALVRDKIDRLIARGTFDDPAQDIDDRDLWDKVKYAPFDKMDADDPATYGDVAIMARGRLVEEPGGYRFTPDKFKSKCTHEKCMENVKALWSVKRVRQRDPETSPGHYHYELTFSVITQAQKKHKKHYEKPARTFTVRESDPEKIMDAPQEHRYYEPAPAPQTPRPDRSLWFHKNILPPARSQARQNHNGLDRLFSSLFSDDDDDVPPPRYKPKQYVPPPPVYQQYSKAGYVGSPSEQHQQKKPNPHGPKPQSYKYSRPIPPPPRIQHHYLDIDAIGVVSNPYVQPQEHRYGPHKQTKTPRPPVLPTPPNPVLPQKNFSIETTTKLRPNKTEETTQQPENVNVYKPHNKQKYSPVKISYMTEHVRPPVYNAPPGVFVTMDKKPFKPMPPLRLVHSTKHHKTTRPVDFRPSPQVLDIQFSEPDPLFENAFRPITVNYGNNNTTGKTVSATNSHLRNDTTGKKPPKKNEIVNAQRVTTAAPEIITAHSLQDDSDAEWTNLLGAFAKTTPMASEKEKVIVPETTTPMTTTTTTTTTVAPTTTVRKRITPTTTTTTTEAPTTTPKPKKRTRPPPKFSKPEKVKKHKRITTTTTEVPEKSKDRDLTPQASSAAATAQLSSSTSTSTTSTTTTEATTTPEQTTTTKPTTTTMKQTTTTKQPTTTTEAQSTPALETEYTKRQNRYRQSTLKHRSTSDKNDKKEEKARTILPPTGKFPPRRKGTKFQSLVPSSTPKNTDKEFDDRGQEKHVASPYKSRTTTTEATTTEKVTSTKPTTAVYENVADHIYITSASPEYSMNQEEDFDEDLEENGEEGQESRERSEQVPSTAAELRPSEKTNEIAEENEDEPLEATEEVTSTTPKSKPKCKKNKNNNANNTTEETKSETTIVEEISSPENTTASLTTTTTDKAVTPDIFQEIFEGFTFEDSPAESENNDTNSKPELDEQESTNQERFIKAEEEFEDFFEAFDEKDRHPDGKFEEYEYDDKEPLIDEEESLFQSEEDRRSPRDSRAEEEYEDYEEPPYSLLELMAME